MKLKHFIVILLMPLFGIGQNQKQIDSLESLINASKKLFHEGQLDSAYHIAKVSYNMAKNLKIDSLQVKVVSRLSSLEPDLEKALTYLAESESLAIKNKYWKYLESIYYARGSIYYHRTNDEKALIHFFKIRFSSTS